jgi:hypothetical protein
MIEIYCTCESATHGKELHRVATGRTLADALAVIRSRAHVAHHSPHHGKQLFYARDFENGRPLIDTTYTGWSFK